MSSTAAASGTRQRGTLQYAQEVQQLAEKPTSTTIHFWKKIQAKLLRTTAKLHYNFGVRGLSCISQGIMMSHRDVENEPRVLVHLWKHECTRVLNDMLNMVEDKMWYDKAIQRTVVEYFGDEVAGSAETPTCWVDFLREPVQD